MYRKWWSTRWLQWLMRLVGILIVVRLAHMQVWQGSEYRRLSENNRTFTERIPAERGVLLDRYGTPLTQNLRWYQISETSAVYAPVRAVTAAEALPVVATQAGLVQYRYARSYPFGSALAHVLGFTGAISQTDGSEIIQADFDQVGKTGLEKSADQELVGKPGAQLFEVDALGRKKRVIATTAALAGQVRQTALDPYLAKVASQALQGLKGAVVILDAQTGQVVTLVSSPSYDPNDLQPAIVASQPTAKRTARLQEYFTNQGQVFFNRAITGLYPPGSLFKLITSAAALESGTITPQSTVEDEGVLRVGEYAYANWYYTQYGRVEGALTLEKALARSNDIFFYTTAQQVGPNTLAEMARAYGLGIPTGVELPGEAAGLVPSPEWKEKTLGEPWYLGNTFHFGIGQGDLLVTPLQMAQLLQAFANQQQLCQPSLWLDRASTCRSVGVSETTTTVILRGMVAACSSGGTAFPFFAHNQAFTSISDVQAQLQAGAVACKTGTAEFGAVGASGYRKTHGWFGMIFTVPDLPSDSNYFQPGLQNLSQLTVSQLSATTSASPLNDRSQWLTTRVRGTFPKELVLVVLVESDQQQPYREGSRDAAPVAKQIYDWIVGNL